MKHDGNISAQGRLTTLPLRASLLYLREVILQDSVAMRRQFPSHPVWDHPAFQHPAYAAFAQDVDASLDPEAAPSRLSVLYQAIPLLADQLQALEARNEQRVEELKQSISQLLALQSTQSLQLQTLTSGNLVFRRGVLDAWQPPAFRRRRRYQQTESPASTRPLKPASRPRPLQTHLACAPYQQHQRRQR